MADDFIKIQTRPTLKELRAMFKEARDRLNNRRDINARLSVLLSGWVSRNFAREGALIGGWAKFKIGGRMVTKGGRRFLDREAKLLQDKGRLRASFIPFSDNDVAGIGSALPYSKSHNDGIPGRLPKRQMLPTHKILRKEIREKYTSWAKKQFKKSGVNP